MIKRFEVPTDGWHDMATAPRDRSVFPVRYRAWNNPSNPLAIQCAQWLITPTGGQFCRPYDVDSLVYADGWMTFDELNAAIGLGGGADG